MSKDIFEDQQQAPAAGAGGAKAKLEKQARQLAYDTKYKVKQALAAKSGGKADPAAVAKMYLAQLAKSPAPPAVKALAKKKLMGEEYVDVKGFVVDSVTDALLKVFVEKKEEVVEEVIEEEKRTKGGEQKFHVKVTDKKTGNSYHRYATRAKIAELRSNPNIASVEMSHYGEGDTKKKAKKDYDGDGKVESSSKEHAGAVHNAIQRKKGGVPDGKDTRKEEVEITEKKSEESNIGGGNLKKLSKKAVKRIDADVDGDVDTNDMKSGEMGAFVPSPDGKKKIKTKVQKESFSDWRNELFETKDVDEDEKEIDVMKGKNKVKVMPNLGEEHGQVRYCPKCDKDETRDECAYGPKYWDENSQPAKEEDPRGMKTKANLVRNKLRAMGLKMSHVPEGEVVSEKTRPELESPDYRDAREKMDRRSPIKPKGVPDYKKPGNDSLTGLKLAHHVPEGELIEAKDEDKEEKEEQKKAEKGEKKTLKNIKKITNKKQRLDKEKYNLQRKGELPLNMSNELEGEQIDEAIPLAVGAGLVGAGLAGWKAIQGMNAANKIKKDAAAGRGSAGAIQRATDAKNRALQQLNQETEFEGEDLQEKPGDGYLGPTVKIGGKPYGIPNPIRIAKDVSDVVNTRNRATVSAANAHRSGSASMIGSTKSYNKDTSVASKTLFGLRHTPNAKEILKQNQSFEPEGETIEERTRYAKETGKDPQTGKPSVKGGEEPPAAMKHLQKSFRSTGGMMSSRKKPIAIRGKKKEPGKKGYQGPTPVDKIRGKLRKKRAPKPDIGSRFD